MRIYRPVSITAAIATLLTATSTFGGVRAFVASYGNDANVGSGCTTAAPCRTFQAAHTAVDPNGEIIAFDAAGYGAVTISKNVSVIGNPGFYAGIAASSGNAVTIATASITVILRNLNINNNGSAANGISMTNGAKLTVENCVISGFTGAGVFVDAPAQVRISNTTVRDNHDGALFQGGATATVSGSRFQGNFDGNGAISVIGSPPGTTTTVSVSDSVFSGNWIGVYSCPNGSTTTRASVSTSSLTNNQYGVAQDACGGTGTVVVSNSLITGNAAYGMYNGGGTMQSLGNNTGGLNTLGNTGGTVTVVPGF